MKSFLYWFWRVVKKWFWVIGFLPIALDLADAYLPMDFYPDQLQVILGNWLLRGLFLIGGFIASAYLVHIEDEGEISKLLGRITELENRQPLLEVGFLDKRNDLDKNLQILLSKVPDPPDYDDLLRRERKELLEYWNNLIDEAHSKGEQFPKIYFRSPLERELNPDYEYEVQEYLEEYRNYLIRLYELSIIEKRAIFITPIIKNIGGQPASEITFEFIMPESYQEPTEEQYLDSRIYRDGDFDMDDYTPSPPKKPSISAKSFQDIVRGVSETFSHPFPMSRQEIYSPSNTDGPTRRVKNGRDFITYTVKKLVQQRSEDDFEPFLLWLESLDASTTWEIGVIIYCAEYINSPKIDTLYIDFIVDEN